LSLSIALVGDYNASVPAHQAIPLALSLSGTDARAVWAPTEALDEEGPFRPDGVIGQADGVWCVPASPYQSMNGALRAIRFAREHGIPFLGTCGGFQHAVIEFARSVLGWHDAAHAETDPDADLTVIKPLACSLVEARGSVRFVPGSKIAAAYGVDSATEGYRCRYGIDPAIRETLESNGLVVTAVDDDGEVRALELQGHSFFVATLFQPERAALKGEAAPLVNAFLRACV